MTAGFIPPSFPAPPATSHRTRGSDSTGLCSSSPNQAHYWRISGNHTATSVGVCRYCHECREFTNNKQTVFAQYKMISSGGVPDKV
jgi:hypothetical protein